MNTPLKSFWPLLAVLLGTAAFVNAQQPEAVQEPWQAVPEGLVFARNFMVPKDQAFAKLPGSLSLGDARARPAPEWWLKVAKDMGLKGVSAEMPLLFCGDLTTPGGRALTVVAQLQHKFSGDGFFSPGPEMWVRVVAIERPKGGNRPVLVSDISRPVGGLQYSCLYAGKTRGPYSCRIRVESGDLNGTTVNSTQHITLILKDDGNVEVERP